MNKLMAALVLMYSAALAQAEYAELASPRFSLVESFGSGPEPGPEAAAKTGFKNTRKLFGVE